MSVHYKETMYGFEYGAAKVQRIANHQGRVWLNVETPKKRLEIYVTKTGKMRVFDMSNGKELK